MQRRTPTAEASRLTWLWQRVGPDRYPIDLPILVKEVINKSSDGDSLKLNYAYFDSIDGALVGSDRKWVATVNTAIKHGGRRRFTLAHEIGHYCCHRWLKAKFDCTPEMIDDFGGSGLEDEANQFASSLLLPPNKVRPIIREGRFNVSIVKGVADRFEVSLAAAGLKSVDLSIRKCAIVLSRDGYVMWGKASEAAFSLGVFFRSGEEVPACLQPQTEVWSNVWEPRTEYGAELEFKATALLSERTGVLMTCLDFGL